MSFTNMKRNKASANDSYEIANFSNIGIECENPFTVLQEQILQIFLLQMSGRWVKPVLSLRVVNKISSLLSG